MLRRKVEVQTLLSLDIVFLILDPQLCDFVDLDGALLLAADRSHPMSYQQGIVSGLTSQLWG